MARDSTPRRPRPNAAPPIGQPKKRNPTHPKIAAVGIGGLVAIIAMSLIDQLAPGMVDFSARLMGVSLGEGIMLLATLVPGWLKSA